MHATVQILDKAGKLHQIVRARNYLKNTVTQSASALESQQSHILPELDLIHFLCTARDFQETVSQLHYVLRHKTGLVQQLLGLQVLDALVDLVAPADYQHLSCNNNINVIA
mgnify:CR=1 FL=1